MATGIDKLFPIEQGYQYGQYGQGSSVGKLGGLTVNPTRVAGVQPTGNEYGISIPTNHSYTTSEDGATKISMGQDGIGLAHRNPDEYGFHLIA